MIDFDQLKKNFDRCGYQIEIFDSRDRLVQAVMDLTKGKSVGFGSSASVRELCIIDAIKGESKELFLHAMGEHGDSERKALTGDIYICSANGVSIQGELVNIDGTGNRVAASCFGPKKILYIIGQNKITADLPSAMDRAKETAIAITQKYQRKTPCVKTGECSECQSPGCVCAITTIHRRKPHGIDVLVYVLKEDLGL